MKSTVKVVINNKFGGFGVSPKALFALIRRDAKCVTKRYWTPSPSDLKKAINGGKKIETPWSESFYEINCGSAIVNIKKGDERVIYTLEADCDRTDPTLVAVVEALGEAANGPSASLKVMTYEYEVNPVIEAVDGRESVELRIKF